jgi:tRNA-(ms[2]io[6]A)-hydroxylase
VPTTRIRALSPAAASPIDRAREVLPLAWWTPPGWGAAVLADELALLADHAQLEREAARNALHLMRRAPSDVDALAWTVQLNGVARDEVGHLGAVAARLADRGGELPRGFSNPYARALRGLVRRGEGREEVADLLLVSALIECRSCERFAHLAATEHDLAPFFGSLMASELGHHRLFLTLAGWVVGETAAAARWQELLVAEGEIAAEQPPGPRIHSGPPAGPASG